MKSIVKVDQASKKEVFRLLEQFEKNLGKEAQGAIEDIAKSVARRLAHTVQPYGLSGAIGEKFKKSIRNQVLNVYIQTNSGNLPAIPNMAQAHEAQRKNGKVKIRKMPSVKWEPIIAESDFKAYVAKKMNNAGIAKAAWVKAANDMGKGDLSKIPQWIARHLNNAPGNAKKSGKGIKFDVSLTNSTTYISSIQKGAVISAEAVKGYANGIKRIDKVLRKEYEKSKSAK